MKYLIFAMASIALISGCGKINVDNSESSEPLTLAAARAAMGKIDGTPIQFRSAFANGDLMVDLYWGSDGIAKECRQWDVLLSRSDGQLLEYRRNLYTEKRTGFVDTNSQEGNNVRISTRTYAYADGLRLKVAEGISVNITGTMKSCDQVNGYKDVSFSVTRKIGKALLGGGVRMLDKHHYIASFLY